MENKRNFRNPDIQLIIVISMTLIASLLPRIIFRELTSYVPSALSIIRLVILFSSCILAWCLKRINIAKYILVLAVIILSEIINNFIYLSPYWQEAFDVTTFIGNFGGSILLKIIGIIPVIGTLLVLFRTPKSVYLTKGDLSVKADRIKWLGIKENTISWRKLAIISAILISFGTILLTVITVTGSSTSYNMDTLTKYFSYVLIFAAFNSLCEGIMYRSAILGSLRNALPKNQVVFIAALIFGIGHYYGAPSGIVGVVMSGILGWYLSRCMYETKGFAASWLIHFMQDVVIFSTILLFGNFS